MDTNILISGIVGVGPALAILWYTLRKYDYPFVEKSLFDTRKVFLMLAVGIVFGMVDTALNASIPVATGPGADLIPVLLLALAFALFEEMFKFIVVNWKGYQLRFDAVFYGFTLGIGMASTMVLSRVYYALAQQGATAYVWAGLMLFSVSMSLVQGTTGAIIGKGAARGRPWQWFFEAMVIRAFLIIVLIPVLANIGEDWMRFASLVLSLVLSAFVYRYAAKDVIRGEIPGKAWKRKRTKSG